MPRNGAGTFSLVAGNPVTTGTTISSTWANNTLSDIASAITQSIAKDGQTVAVANLPMGGFKHTGAADATATGQYLTYGQDGTVLGDTTIAGTLAVEELATFEDGATMDASTMVWAKGADVASATTLPLINDGNYFDVTGTTTITAFASLGVGTWIGLHFDGALTLTHNATDLVLPSGANITTAAGDESIWVEYATGDWRCVSYTRADGTPVVATDKIQPITASVGSNALTITLNPTTLDFRSATLGSGTVNTRVVSSAISVVVSSGSTLGTTNGVENRLTVLAIDNAGTVELAVVNNTGGINLDESSLISTTAEGGAGAADSANVIYSTTARSNVSYRVVGYVVSTQATAGTWATAPSKIQGAGGIADVSVAMNAAGNAPIFACRAWVNFNGTRNVNDTGASSNGNPVFIRGSGNVTSVVKNSTGNYTINFTTAISDANYSVSCCTQVDGSDDARFLVMPTNAGLSTSSLTIVNRTTTNSVNDGANIHVQVFR